MLAAIERAKELITNDEVEELTREDYLLGYDAQKQMATNLCIASVKYKIPINVLAFGYPGTGKTVFPRIVLRDLNTIFKLPYSMLSVKSDALTAGFSEEEIKKTLNREIRDAVRDYKPLIIVFDEMDALSSPIAPLTLSVRALTQWVRVFMDDIKKEKLKDGEGLVVFGVTNYPFEIERAIFRRFDFSIYFDLPKRGNAVFTEILKEWAVPRIKEVSEKLYKNKKIVVGKQLIDALNITKIMNFKLRKDLSTDEIVNIIEKNAPLSMGGTDAEGYEKTYDPLISDYRERLKVWGENKYKEFLAEFTKKE